LFVFRSLKKKNKGHRSKSPSPAMPEQRNESPNYYPPRDDINYVPHDMSNEFVDVDYSPDARESSRSPYGSEGPGPYDEEGEVRSKVLRI
jgi:hypothetical protein